MVVVPVPVVQLQNKLSEARSTLQNSVDPNTGKRLFHPEIGRAPRFSRNTSHQPVSDYLYSLSQQQVRGGAGLTQLPCVPTGKGCVLGRPAALRSAGKMPVCACNAMAINHRCWVGGWTGRMHANKGCCVVAAACRVRR